MSCMETLRKEKIHLLTASSTDAPSQKWQVNRLNSSNNVSFILFGKLGISCIKKITNFLTIFETPNASLFLTVTL